MNYKMNRALAALITVIFLLTFALTGCGGTSGQNQSAASSAAASGQSADQLASSTDKAATAASSTQTNSGESSTGVSSQTAADKFPLKVTDANGFEMTIASKPQHIVSLTLGTDEILIGLVDKSRIIALTKYADDPGISNVSAEAAGVANRAVMEKTEGTIALKPDLVILDTWADPKYVKQMRDAGITVYTFKTPSNIEEQEKVIADIANITGEDEKGREMIEWMNEKLKEVENRLSKLKPEEKLTAMDYGEMGSSGKGTNFDDIVTRAGLENVVSKAGMTGWPVVSKEKMIEMNPDIIILPSWYYDKKNSLQGMKDKLEKDKSLQTIRAIKNNRLISLPNPHISAISQYVVLGVEDVAKAVYPELYK